LIQVAIDSGRPPPKAILEAPLLDEYSEPYWSAFQCLSNCRQYTEQGVPQALAFTEIAAYGEIYHQEDFDLYLDIMQALDGVYLKEKTRELTAKRRTRRG